MILIAKISNGVKRKVQNHSVKQKMKYEIRNTEPILRIKLRRAGKFK